MNAVIRAVVKAATNHGIEVIGLEDSFDGLIYPERSRRLVPSDVTGIIRLGGTILGTVNRGNPFVQPIVTPEGTFDYADRVMEMFGVMQLDALVCIGGDGTLAVRGGRASLRSRSIMREATAGRPPSLAPHPARHPGFARRHRFSDVTWRTRSAWRHSGVVPGAPKVTCYEMSRALRDSIRAG